MSLCCRFVASVRLAVCSDRPCGLAVASSSQNTVYQPRQASCVDLAAACDFGPLASSIDVGFAAGSCLVPVAVAGQSGPRTGSFSSSQALRTRSFGRSMPTTLYFAH